MLDLMTTAEAAELLRVDQSYARRLVADGRLPEVARVGRTILVRRADVERHARERRPRGRPKGWRAVTQLSSNSHRTAIKT